MKKTASLCFNGTGLLNPEAIDFISNNPDIKDIVLFGDGSLEAFREVIKAYKELSTTTTNRIGLGKTPAYELRVVNQDGSLSRPNYVYSDDVRIQWLCTKVCAPHMHIHLYNSTMDNATKVKLTRKQTENVCFLAYKLWDLILTVEDRLAFPAVVIEKLIEYTYYLTDNTMDIKKLRKETGIESLDYNTMTDLLSVEVLGDIFFVKLSVLNALYGELILPFFRDICGRKLSIDVSVVGISHRSEDVVTMSYGMLGRTMDEMKIGCRERPLSNTSLLDPIDLVMFAKKVKIDDETCLWVDEETSIETIEKDHIGLFVRGITVDDQYD
jgi:hypothetical protein